MGGPPAPTESSRSFDRYAMPPTEVEVKASQEHESSTRAKYTSQVHERKFQVSAHRVTNESRATRASQPCSASGWHVGSRAAHRSLRPGGFAGGKFGS